MSNGRVCKFDENDTGQTIIQSHGRLYSSTGKVLELPELSDCESEGLCDLALSLTTHTQNSCMDCSHAESLKNQSPLVRFTMGQMDICPFLLIRCLLWQSLAQRMSCGKSLEH